MNRNTSGNPNSSLRLSRSKRVAMLLFFVGGCALTVGADEPQVQKLACKGGEKKIE